MRLARSSSESRHCACRANLKTSARQPASARPSQCQSVEVRPGHVAATRAGFAEGLVSAVEELDKRLVAPSLQHGRIVEFMAAELIARAAQRTGPERTRD